MSSNVPLSEVPVWMWLLFGVLAVIQISVEVYALIKLLKTPDERLVFGKKWPWVLIILFVNLIGAIVFLAAGRKPAAATDPLASAAPGAQAAGDRAARAADVLYGAPPVEFDAPVAESDAAEEDVAQ
ncbi:MAG: PLDc_N domain-containing protein [Actinobacteria bacterium]|nr:PLDc_N domain-containing protein [Actinomycetota bacterium]